MSVMPQPILEPLVFMSGNNGVSGLGSVKKKPEIWHIQVDQNTFHEPRAQHRENPSKVSQLENTIQFMNKQHNDVLRSLQAEIEALKQRNRDLQFSALTSDDPRVSQNLTFHHVIPTGSTIPPLATDSKKLRNLEDEVDKLKQLLIEQREQNKKLQTLVEGYKRSIPLTNNSSKRDANLDSATPPQSAYIQSPNPSPVDDIASQSSSKLHLEEALPFSLKPFVVHPPNQPDRTPSLNECQAIIAQLSFHCQHQHEELTELKQGLKDALYSQKWTPDAYLLAKAIVNDPTDADSRPLSADDKGKRTRPVKIPEAAYSLKEHGSLPALRQTLQPGVIERQKKVNTMQKKRLRNYIVSKNQSEPNQNLLQPQPPSQPHPPPHPPAH
ncbi:uncharacterized protein LOC142343968 [Convolutriloba macropyga]|uniref:uncharacterized protein LOC142343968 n=1 Tax=Convolutriloba macropyga TaxID=536237 RepID=UPI003F51EC36